ncbi:MAG: dicarboxylate transporter, DctM subunit [Deltaproteobacteria bacterium]|nr:dicarboxylate transporter, DctM subunit [Deltaproteobacteria bacterium]
MIHPNREDYRKTLRHEVPSRVPVATYNAARFYQNEGNIGHVLTRIADLGAAIILFALMLSPILTHAGFHPLRVGFVFVFNLVVGMFISPVGICLFVGCSIARISMESLTKAIWPFITLLVAVLFLFACFPQTAMIVPKIFKIGV